MTEEWPLDLMERKLKVRGFDCDPESASPLTFQLCGLSFAGTFFGQSSFGRHAVVVEMSCVKVPKGTDLTMLAPLGCGLQTG